MGLGESEFSPNPFLHLESEHYFEHFDISSRIQAKKMRIGLEMLETIDQSRYIE